jgi:hypothetical protein
MSDLAAFFSARIDEEEARAKALADRDWGLRPWEVTECAGQPGDPHDGCPCIVYQGEYGPVDEPQIPQIQYIADAEAPEYAAHIADHDPARVLREVAAKRSMLRMYQDAVAEAGSEVVEWMLAVIETEARIWSDHPGFDPAWA